jgi:RNA polymerase sigma factor (sigma-70 family)
VTRVRYHSFTVINGSSALVTALVSPSVTSDLIAPVASPELSDICEQSLLDRLAAGDAMAFWDLWSRHQKLLFSICYVYMDHHYEDAEDALSIIREKARETLPRDARKVRNLTAWLTRMTVNLCIDIYRRDKNRLRRVGRFKNTLSERLSTLQSSDDACPAARLLDSEVRAIVSGAVESLPPRLRVASALYFLEELSYPAIAGKLMISEVNARKRIQEARGILRRQLRFELFDMRPSGARSAFPPADASPLYSIHRTRAATA